MTDTNDAAARRARGLDMYKQVYGENAALPPGGSAEFFDLLVIDQQFAEVWTRPGLPIGMRRLLVIGVLAATQRFDILEIQFARTLATGELTVEQIREVVIHLISYVGTPSSGDLYRASETAIAAHLASTEADRDVSAAPTIGFVGVGNMGFAMARRAVESGAIVIGFDPTPAARDRLAVVGATMMDDAASVAAHAPIVSVVVNTDQQVRDSMLAAGGVLDGAKPGTVVAIHSTIHLETLEAVASAAAERGVTVVDAAVTGGVDAAAAGELAALLGGDVAAVDAMRPALASYASLVVRAGDLGAGMAAKIALMVISFGKLAAAYEGLLLADAAGVDVDEFARIVAHSERVSGMHGFFLAERARRFAPDYAGSLLAIAAHESPKSQKDLHAALELAARVGVSLPVAAAAHDEMPAAWGAGVTPS